MCSGDFCQHQPPTGAPLFFGADSTAIIGQKWKAADKLGRMAWMHMNTCVILTQQHRFTTDTSDGKLLYKYVQLLSRETQPTLEECAELCDALNSCAITDRKFAELSTTVVPRAVVLRNRVRPFLNARLAKLEAALANKRLIVWRCTDVGLSSKPLSAEIIHALEQLPSDKTGDMPTVQMFFPGIKYKFSHNLYPHVGHVNNNMAVGHTLYLDPREEDHPDDETKPYRVLRYMPLAIAVVPDGGSTSHLHLPGWPKGCIPVEQESSTFKLKLPAPTPLFKNEAEEGTVVSIRRRGFSLDMANAVTDFFAQGVSFRGEPHMLHLNIPPDGHLSRANILVPVSRPSLFSQLHLLAPLWPDGDLAARSKVIMKVHSALKPNPHHVAEMDRLRELAKKTHTEWNGSR